MINPFTHILLVLVWLGVVVWGITVLWRDVLSVEPPRKNTYIKLPDFTSEQIQNCIFQNQHIQEGGSMKIYQSVKQFFQKVGKHILYTQGKTGRRSSAPGDKQALKKARTQLKADGLRCRVTKKKNEYKATVRNEAGDVTIGFASDELGAINKALEAPTFINGIPTNDQQFNQLKSRYDPLETANREAQLQQEMKAYRAQTLEGVLP